MKFSNEFYVMLGYALILYGILKLSLCTYRLLPIERNKEKDNTLAGVFVFYVIILFAMFTLVKGAAWAGFIDIHLGLAFYIMMNGIFGTALLLFYILVIFTDVPIPKREDKTKEYEAYGICTGLAFIASIPLTMFYKMKRKMSLEGFSLLGLGMLLVAIDIYIFIISGHLREILDLVSTSSVAFFNAI